MARYSVDYCQQMLDAYTAASMAVLRSQSYSFGGRTLTRANLAEIQKGIEYWSAELEKAKAGNSGRMRMFSAIPH